jgi:hypothetical protein
MPMSTHHIEESTRKKKKAPARNESMQPLTENISDEIWYLKLVYVVSSILDLSEDGELKGWAGIG